MDKPFKKIAEEENITPLSEDDFKAMYGQKNGHNGI